VTSESRVRLEAQDLRVGYGGREVLTGLDLRVRTGAVTAIIGPNGSGKSTLLRTLGRLLEPVGGSVLLSGDPIASLPTREVAKRIALLPQGPTAPEGMTVQELVARGRHPHQTLFRQWTVEDEDKVTAALELTGLIDLADRNVETLSGGQRQRAWIALTLAQDTDILLLDEPTTYLDISHSLEVLDLVDRLHTDLGRTVVMVIHDLNLAARYADELVVVHGGGIVAQGPPEEVVTERLLDEVFQLKSRVIVDPVSGSPLILPIGQRHILVEEKLV
jgi:iron complex transport system ATP-binding protein